MEKFTKWGTIPPELRHHALTYFDGESQFNYAQCSKMCHKEIQKVDQAIPASLRLRDLKSENSGLSIEMTFCDKSHNNEYLLKMEFVDVETNKHKWIVYPSSKYIRVNDINERKDSTRVYQMDDNATYDGTAMEGAAKFLHQRCNRSFSNRFVIRLFMDSWPFELSSILTHFYKSMWMIEITETIYQGFMEFMENAPAEMKIRFLDKNGKNPYCLPSGFLETDLFKNIRILESHIPLVITDEQFLNSKAEILSLERSTVSSETFHQKLLNWFDDADHGHRQYQIGLSTFNINTVIGDLPFIYTPRQNDDDDTKYYEIRKSDGAIGSLWITPDFISFEAYG